MHNLGLHVRGSFENGIKLERYWTLRTERLTLGACNNKCKDSHRTIRALCLPWSHVRPRYRIFLSLHYVPRRIHTNTHVQMTYQKTSCVNYSLSYGLSIALWRAFWYNCPRVFHEIPPIYDSQNGHFSTTGRLMTRWPARRHVCTRRSISRRSIRGLKKF